MTCLHSGPFDGHLPCTRPDHPDDPGGHTYETGSWVNDGHEEGGHG